MMKKMKRWKKVKRKKWKSLIAALFNETRDDCRVQEEKKQCEMARSAAVVESEERRKESQLP